MTARTCTQCGNGMNEGFTCCGDYYCNEKCLTTGTNTRDQAEWEATHYSDEGECYWTEWEEGDTES